ncbi:MAG: hypothetical protein JNL81_10780 [Hyphomonadaceae bacterium]|nr:hypothetical protein [Hyphomonadaceae bacterium]
MRQPLRVLALACALTLMPACAALQIGQTRVENPIAVAQTMEQRAYALLHAYAAIVEEATEIVADPATPLAFKRTLGQVERAATPAAETLQIAVTAYLRARADFEAASGANQTALQRGAATLAIAARRLNEAVAAAQAPIAELDGLVRAHRD